MDWIKIKTSHVLYEGFNKCSLWAWIRLLALTAQLEKMPNDNQIRSVITKREQQSVEKHLAKCGKSVRQVLEKCLEDVGKVQDDRNRKKAEREKHKDVIMPKTAISSVDVPGNFHGEGDVDKIRGDKIREEEKGKGDPATFLLNTWKAQNREADKAYPTFAVKVHEAISAALARGVTPAKIEARLWEVAGKGIKPWELFPQPKQDSQPSPVYPKYKPDPSAEKTPMPADLKSMLGQIGKPIPS